MHAVRPTQPHKRLSQLAHEARSAAFVNQVYRALVLDLGQ